MSKSKTSSVYVTDLSEAADSDTRVSKAEVLAGDPADEGRLVVDLDGSEVTLDHYGSQLPGASYWTADKPS